MTEFKHNLNDDSVIHEVSFWLEKAVIGLNFCPFAKSVYIKQQIRFVVSHATTVEALLSDLIVELQYLAQVEPEKTDTTLLIHPLVLQDFLDYNDFLDLADRVLVRHGWEGEFQIASFHPDYQFAGSDADSIENYTNRAPWPLLHLLRETSIEKAVDAFPDAAEIYQKNIATMQRLGSAGWAKLFKNDSPDQIIV
jgi:uncharacterized protein